MNFAEYSTTIGVLLVLMERKNDKIMAFVSK